MSEVSLWPQAAVRRGRAAAAFDLEGFAGRELDPVGRHSEIGRLLKPGPPPGCRPAHRESLDPGTGRPQIG